MTSTEQVKRLLLLVPYLLRHPGISVAEVAHAFAIAPRQVQDDLNVLWMCGLPEGLPDDLIEIDMDAVQDEGVIRLSNADYLVRPLRFTHQEAVALVVALSAVAELGDTQTRSDAQSAAAKLVAISGQTDPVTMPMPISMTSSCAPSWWLPSGPGSAYGSATTVRPAVKPPTRWWIRWASPCVIRWPTYRRGA